MSTDNAWAWWQAALEGNFGPMHEGEPQQGYYRTRFKGGQWEPVALWRGDDGEWLGRRGDKMVDDVGDLWNFCRTHPVTVEAWEKAINGGGWDDEPPAPAIGHNSGSRDPLDAINLELAGEKEMAREFLASPVETQEAANKAGIWSKRLSDLAKRADNLRADEKEPHLVASREVDNKWRGPIAEAKDLATALKLHVEPFLIAQRRAEEERARKAAQEAAELRRQAEEAARKSAESDQKAEMESAELLRQAAEADKRAVERNASAGRTGAKVSLRTFVSARVTDYRAAALALLDANHPDLKAVIDQLANRTIKAGIELAGVEKVEEKRAV
ncbi:hypothetical protein KYK29_10220 [Shinella daejeonensis]|uniref:hypothetical protein n=1 Tax=Shinella daejeonensis TaxID=659017 RepID=UPI0020C7DBB2|nr:hypothetical protein [Shinella daejeonensis]MCP8895310.1 hypothetical protein [Shinella daejeonensis]